MMRVFMRELKRRKREAQQRSRDEAQRSGDIGASSSLAPGSSRNTTDYDPAGKSLTLIMQLLALLLHRGCICSPVFDTGQWHLSATGKFSSPKSCYFLVYWGKCTLFFGGIGVVFVSSLGFSCCVLFLRRFYFC